MRWAAGIGSGVLAIVACGTQIPTSIIGDDANGPPDGSASFEASTDANVILADGGADTAEPLPTGGNGAVDPCAESYQPGASDVFVTDKGSDDADCGSTTKPCSLARALAARPQTIDIADGTYTTPLKIASTSLRIFGGWSVAAGVWKRSCVPGKVVLNSSIDTGVRIDNSAVTLSYVDVMTKPAAAPGETMYGLIVTNVARVTLDHVNVLAAAGGNGTDGPIGAAATTYDCFMIANGLNGSPGTAGVNGTIAFGADGLSFVNPSGGTAGTAGHPGYPALIPLTDTSKGRNCTAGSSGTVNGCVAVDCAHAIRPGQGTNGCGGLGGNGGGPGMNGGSSVGLYVTGRSTVSVVSGSIKAGNGGNAGKGGKGGSGSEGQLGSEGQGVSDNECMYDSLMDCSGLLEPECQSPSSVYTLPGGSAGGQGGRGGDGGKGGDGVGGRSYGWVRDATSNVELAASAPAPTIIIGAPGTGAGAEAAESKTF